MVVGNSPMKSVRVKSAIVESNTIADDTITAVRNAGVIAHINSQNNIKEHGTVSFIEKTAIQVMPAKELISKIYIIIIIANATLSITIKDDDPYRGTLYVIKKLLSVSDEIKRYDDILSLIESLPYDHDERLRMLEFMWDKFYESENIDKRLKIASLLREPLRSCRLDMLRTNLTKNVNVHLDTAKKLAQITQKPLTFEELKDIFENGKTYMGYTQWAELLNEVSIHSIFNKPRYTPDITYDQTR